MKTNCIYLKQSSLIHLKKMIGLSLLVIMSLSCNDDDSGEEAPAAFFSYILGNSEANYFIANFSDESKGGQAVSWVWDFGVEGTDTDVSSEQNPTYVFPEEEATYTVTLVVSNSAGQSDTFSSEVIISKKVDDPVALFIAEAGSTPSDYYTVSFADASTGGVGVEWLWDFGLEDTVSNEQNPVFNYPQKDGIYTVTLTVTNAVGVTSTYQEEINIEYLKFTTTEHMEEHLVGGYRLLASEQLYGRKLTLALMIRSDMVTYGDPTTAIRRIVCDGMNMGANNDLVNAFWPQGYALIDSVNVLIDDAGVDIEGASEDEINPLIAEARFLRALIHYHFVRLFGEIPLRLTAPRGQEDEFEVLQYSVEEVYESIIADLTYAKQWLPNISREDRIRSSKGSASGLLASVYLTREMWQEAYTEAKYVIDNSGSFNYGLESDFANLFGAVTSSDEILFETDNVGGDGYAYTGEQGGSNASTDQITSVTGPRGDERFTNVNSSSFGWSAIVPSLEVHDTWPDTYRKAVSLDTVITYTDDFGVTHDDYFYTEWGNIAQNVPRPHVAKYFRATGQAGYISGASLRDSETNYFVMRYAEVLLIAAEASMELGNLSEARTLINQVRSRSGLDDLSISEVTLENLLEERRLELAFEFKRWYDIIRRDLMSEAFDGSGLETQPWTAKDYLFPKPEYALIEYENLTQNIGY